MGRKSIKENKNIYQTYREKADLTREQASNLMEYISADRIEKIESEKSQAHADEIITMSECYNAPELCNYYCSHECQIGRKYVPEVQVKDLSQIILETIASLNTLNKEKDRLIEIAADGNITDDEYEDFIRIQNQLSKISLSIDSLNLWIQKNIT